MIDTILITFRDYISQPTCSVSGQAQVGEPNESSSRHDKKSRRTLRTQHSRVGSAPNTTDGEDPTRQSAKLETSGSPPSSLPIGVLPDRLAADRTSQLRIPRILHQLYFVSDKAKDYETGSIEDKQFPKKWQASCKAAFPDWEYRFWNLESAEEWMSSKFPGFMKTWHSYPRTVLKGDAFRAFVLKDMGGLYLDLDIECFQHREHMLNGLDLVLQVAYPGAWDLDNGAFGSTAGHPYWDTYIKLLTERASISPAEGPLRYDHVVRSTGPDVTYDAYLEWGKPEVRHGFVTDIVQKDGLVSMAYPLGEWFFPCLWDAITCHADMNERKRNMDFPEHLAGHHYSVVSWFKELGEKI
ncbi:hypothetical protein WJX84_011171 [Apatococcus fuscideae]|uniref:Uncharacterized protein n=1 Tax=Apatococcus fuscideae TaxID=2026836 RepID=A0AAW1T459_9CHLO